MSPSRTLKIRRDPIKRRDAETVTGFAAWARPVHNFKHSVLVDSKKKITKSFKPPIFEFVKFL